MIIEFDLDDTILTQGKPCHYDRCKSVSGAVEIVNQLYDLGHTIILASARHWKNFDLTYKQLKELGFRFHSLILGKINADIVVDDRSIRSIKDLTMTVFERAVEKEPDKKVRKQKKQELQEIRTKIYHTE